ncbi:hypothetical protein HY498_02625 [Candidatus Woesearchaeota archaeon]|nr:hypothetical protein [Candidatus Woesearchaeota archaeon]
MIQDLQRLYQAIGKERVKDLTTLLERIGAASSSIESGFKRESVVKEALEEKYERMIKEFLTPELRMVGGLEN